MVFVSKKLLADWASIPEHQKPKASSWVVEGTPYEIVQKDLAKKGFKYPWLRNELYLLEHWRVKRVAWHMIRFRCFKGAMLIALGSDFLQTMYYKSIGKANP